MANLTKPRPGLYPRTGHPLLAELTGCYLFNEGSGTQITDYSGWNNHGNLATSSPGMWDASQVGTILRTTSTQNFIELGYATNLFQNQNSSYTVVHGYRKSDTTLRMRTSSGLGSTWDRSRAAS